MRKEINSRLHNKEWLYQKYIVEEKSSVKIAKEIGSNPSTVLTTIKRYGFKLRSTSDAAKKRQRLSKVPELGDKIWLKQKYETEKLNSYEIADLLSVTQSSVYKRLKHFGIQIRDGKEAARLRKDEHLSKYDKLNDKSWLENKYSVEHLTCAKIAEILGCTASNVANRLKKFGIDRRDNVEVKKYTVKKSYRYDLLNNKEWLREQYVDKNLVPKIY